jgi:hypothetical protein
LGVAEFDSPTRYLQVEVDTGGGYTALPRQELASVPYAYIAESAANVPWSGLTGVPAGFADGLDDVELENVILVAKSGGHFDSIQAAVDSITGASPENPYLVWVGPGTYEEQVILKEHVHLTGAGEWLTMITSSVNNPDIIPPITATLHLTRETNVKNLTVINEGNGYRNVAILGLDGAFPTNLTNVTAVASGDGEIDYGIFLYGDNTGATLDYVTAYATQGTIYNAGLQIVGGADATLQNGAYEGFNGRWGVGINVADSGSSLWASDVRTLAADCNQGCMGLSVNQDAAAVVHGGDFTARTAYTETMGISVSSGASLEAYGVNSVGIDGVLWNNGLASYGGMVYLYGGTFAGLGGNESYGIINWVDGYLEATGIKAVGEGGIERNDGFRNESGSVSKLTGSLFDGIGGLDARGIANYNAGSIVDLNQCTVQGLDATNTFGVSNEDEASTYISGSELFGTSISFLNDGAQSGIHLTRLIGGGTGGSGSTTCLAVTWGSAFYADTCP